MFISFQRLGRKIIECLRLELDWISHLFYFSFILFQLILLLERVKYIIHFMLYTSRLHVTLEW